MLKTVTPPCQAHLAMLPLGGRQEAPAALPKDASVGHGSVVWNGRFLARPEGPGIAPGAAAVALSNSTGPGPGHGHLGPARPNRLPQAGQPRPATLALSEPGAPASAPTAAKKKTK